MIRQTLARVAQPLLLVALFLSIPAFYLQLTGDSDFLRRLGSQMYGAVAVLVALDLLLRWNTAPQPRMMRDFSFDLLICLGAAFSAWPAGDHWCTLEWALRAAVSGVVFLRLTQVLVGWLGPHHLFQVLGLALVLLAAAGAGFYWLEPQVGTYADGLWLAFTTGATVGYGDIIPSTPASRIFAVFIVLLGYAVFSVVTATIAALFVSEDERRFERELHSDIRALRREIDDLRKEMRTAVAGRDAMIRDLMAPGHNHHEGGSHSGHR